MGGTENLIHGAVFGEILIQGAQSKALNEAVLMRSIRKSDSKEEKREEQSSALSRPATTSCSRRLSPPRCLEASGETLEHRKAASAIRLMLGAALNTVLTTLIVDDVAKSSALLALRPALR